MPPDRHLILYHSPRSRSAGARMLLEELNADYELHAFDLSAGQHHEPAYRAINPLGKVPALRHGDVVVTEQAAVYLYAAELYPEAGLAPATGDPLRGSYLRWMVFYGSCFEPAIVDRSMNRSACSVFDVTLRRLRYRRRHDRRATGQRALSARRTLHRSGRAVGVRAELDHDVQTDARDAGGAPLSRPRARTPRHPARAGGRCGAGGGAGQGEGGRRIGRLTPGTLARDGAGPAHRRAASTPLPQNTVCNPSRATV